MSDTAAPGSPQLERTLGPVMLWGLGVGYVISGMYFGWNLGLAEGGMLGMAWATAIITVMYIAFTFSYTELACAIPRAGGAFDYAMRGLGRNWGFLGGMAQNIEFIFAPPAIAFAIGAYVNIFFPAMPPLATAIGAYFVFTVINIVGVRTAASFEFAVTIVAVVGLVAFAGATLPAFDSARFHDNALPQGWTGIFAALPFAIWFFLAIEGVANIAEETINPGRNILIGFGSALATLVVLCALTFVGSVGVDGWEAIVYPEGPGGKASDSPLPLAMARAVGDGHLLYKIVAFCGLFGLIASFHGIILSAGRSTLEFGRVGFAPAFLGRVHPGRRTPANALLVNMAIGIVALLTGKTAEIITIACFGALTLYIISMIALFALRTREPHLERPFRAPLYPLAPTVALVIAGVSLIALTTYNPVLALLYFGLLGGTFVLFKLRVNHRVTQS
jgi:ethanolamine permease